MERLLRVLSLGAGVQSTTVLLMSCRGVLPKLDCAIFADTLWEPRAVYSHLDWLQAHAEACGIPVHRVCRGSLRQDVMDFQAGRIGSHYASMPFFVKPPEDKEDQREGRVRQQCTNEYKTEIIERFIREELIGVKRKQRVPRGVLVDHWLGISWDEAHRMRTSDLKWRTFRYPLITDVESPVADLLFPRGFARQDCLDWLAKHGYPRPPKSACIGCPWRGDAEWAVMKKNRPEEWADAVDFDRALRGPQSTFDGTPFLHRSLVPLDQVELGDLPEGYGNECTGVCGV